MAKMTDKEKAEAKARREELAKVEKARVAKLTDAEKKAEKLAKASSYRVIVALTERNKEIGIMVVTVATRGQAKAIADGVSADNEVKVEMTKPITL